MAKPMVQPSCRVWVDFRRFSQKLNASDTTIYSELSSNEDHFGQMIQNPIEDSKQYIKVKK